MRLPPSVRYLPSRFQVLLNPWLWLSLLLTGVVGVYAWEYRQNPGRLPWQLSDTGLGQSGDSTSTDVLLESLTPEEQAVAVDLDNVELLLAQLDEDLAVLTAGGDASAAASLNAVSTGVDASQVDAPEAVSESSVERLNRYIDEYRFIGTQTPESSTTLQSRAALIQQPSETQQPSAPPQTSALAEAFARQQAQLNTSSTIPADTDEEPAEDITLEEAIDDPSTLFFDQSGVTAGGLDGLNRSFIRTTPNMSPPPGTTGYVPPASLPDFNRLNRPSSSVPLPAQPATGFNSSAPSVNIPDRSQVLPPTQSSVVTPLEIPSFDDASEAAPNQPRNAWEALWD